MIVTELYLTLRNRCVRVTDKWVKRIANSCTSIEFLYPIFDLENILLALSCYRYIVELEYSIFSFKKEHLNVPYTI
jgi:hypothetical protein